VTATDRAAIEQAFDLVATNVAVITVADAAGIHGCTANCWAEAHDPLLLLVTLRRDGATRKRIGARRRFAVNLLAGDQAPLARQFARTGDRFADVSYHDGELGQPLLEGALANLECELQDEHPFGALDILIGRPVSAGVSARLEPLLFFSRRFHAGAGPRS
jgi:flavin reductase (DIM6/NTAB) family NADH-FMN oxidoreductase RutF